MSSFVLVHGICHGAWCWERTVEGLTERGHHVVAVDLPLTSLAADAATVEEAVDEIAEQAILVGHSYGGLVISKAAAGRSDVEQLVYVAAVMLDSDDVFLERTADFPATPLAGQVEITDGRIVVSPDAAIVGFYNTCDAADAAAAAGRLRPTSAECLATPPGAEPWRTIPSTYLLCDQDQAIHPDMQRWMSSRAGEVIAYDTDHSPFLSTTAQLVDDLDRLARRRG